MEHTRRVNIVVPKIYSFFTNRKNKKVGGAEIQLYHLGKAMQKRGYSIHYIVADYGQAATEVHEGLYFHKVFSYSENPLVSLVKICNFVRKNKSSLFVFRSASLQTALVLLLSRYLFRTKQLYMVASDMEVVPELFLRDRSKLTVELMNKAYQKVDLLTCQNQQQLQALHKKGREAILLPNLKPPRKQEQKEKNNVLWVGKSMQMKNAELFIDLAENNSNCTYTMVVAKTKEKDTYWNELKQRASTISNLNFLGQVSHEEVLEQTNKAWCYVITSEYEGFSNSMMEAMQAGCAILSYKVNPDGLFDTEEVGLCAQGSKTAFFEAFTELNTNRGNAEEIGKKAQKYIEDRHSEKVISNKFWNRLSELVD